MNFTFIHSSVILSCIYAVLGGLMWTKSAIPLRATNLNLKTTTTDIVVDMFYEAQTTVIRDVQQWNHSIIMQCFISGFNERSPILYSFCKNDDPCVKLGDKSESVILNEFNLVGNIAISFVDKKVFRVTFQIPDRYTDISGNYFCKVDNDKMVIQSNYVEIRDTFFWERKLFSKVESSFKSDIQSITMVSLPYVLNCSDGNSMINSAMPSWAQTQFASPVAWFVCPVLKNYKQLKPVDIMSTEKCLFYTWNKCNNLINERICPRNLNKMSGWKYLITKRGDLIFTDIPPQNPNEEFSYVFMCYTKDLGGEPVSISYFLNKKQDASIESGIFLDGSQRIFTTKLEAVSHQTQYYTISARQAPFDSSSDPVAIHALYKSSSSASFEWRFNGVNLNTNSMTTVSKYMVTFEGDITSSLSGVYTLEVKDGLGQLTFDIRVQVIGLPSPVNNHCVPRRLYVWENDGASLSCFYSNRPSTMKLRINGQEIQLNDTLATSQVQLKSSYQYLDDLLFNVTPTKYIETDFVTMTYNVFHLRKTKPFLYQDHTVTFIASNNYGASVKMTSIYVVPPLKTVVNHYPESDNCTTSCSSSEVHMFGCDINAEEYKNKELTVDHYWTIGSHRLEEVNKSGDLLSRYFFVNPRTKEVTLVPIISKNVFDQFIRELLKDTYLVCNVEIRSSSSADSNFVYVSSQDKEINERMRARIQIDQVHISTANFYWVIAPIIVTLAVVVGVVLLVFYLKKRGAGGPNVTAKYQKATTTPEV